MLFSLILTAQAETCRVFDDALPALKTAFQYLRAKEQAYIVSPTSRHGTRNSAILLSRSLIQLAHHTKSGDVVVRVRRNGTIVDSRFYANGAELGKEIGCTEGKITASLVLEVI
jgi:hypothetical protein